MRFGAAAGLHQLERETQPLVQTSVFIIQVYRIIILHISGNTVWSCTGGSEEKKHDLL